MNTLVVNFLAGPGAGKSTLATGTFSSLKWNEIECEYVSEFAKDIVWGETTKILDDPIYVFAEQQHRMRRLMGKVEVIITDAPLINSILYYNGPHPESYTSLVLDVIGSMNNLNFLVKRKKKYHPLGRLQTACEASALDSRLEELLIKHDMAYTEIDGIPSIIPAVVENIKAHLSIINPEVKNGNKY